MVGRQSQPENHTGRHAYTVRDMPPRLRPREAMARVGASRVSDDVLLAVILRSGVRGTNVVDLSRELLNRYGSLTNLATASVDDLQSVKGMGQTKAQVLTATLELAKRLTEESVDCSDIIRTPGDAADILKEEARTLEKEVFWVLLLDAKNRLKGSPVSVSQGLLDASLVHSREVFREAVRSASAAVVLVHNHPSGDPSPSAEDIRITRQLVQAGNIIGIDVLDHVVLGRPRMRGGPWYISLREAGLVEFH